MNNIEKHNRLIELNEEKLKVDLWKVSEHISGHGNYPEEVEKLNQINQEIEKIEAELKE